MWQNLSWIVTLDVLKSEQEVRAVREALSWIVTLDVLKFKDTDRIRVQIGSWIVTLDVLKFIWISLLSTSYSVE